MPLTEKTATSTFDDILAGAKRYVEMYPLVSQPNETRIFMHAMLNYFQELGVRRVERDRILAAWTEAVLAASERGFNIGWDKGYEYGKSKTAPPF